MNINFHISNCI